MDYLIQNRKWGLAILCCLFIVCCLHSQESRQSLRFSGQMTGYAQLTPDISSKLWLGARYIPQVNSQFQLSSQSLLDFEASANMYVEQPLIKRDEVVAKLKPYRAWGRYSTRQLEVRVGLQKINFGSAMMFRPLMWFDKIDPRDPLQMTDGVWGGLFRYYFLNNANLWFWSLYGNKELKGWETIPAYRKFPELGGRVQYPIPSGEIALSYHFRKTDLSKAKDYATGYDDLIKENRVGFDLKLNLAVGLWLEGSWTHLSKQLGILTNQTMVTLGADYTFDIGNGLAMTYEQLVYILGEKAFSSDQSMTYSGLLMSYPISIFDNLQAMFYFDWKGNLYNFVNWQKQYNSLTFHFMAYWNPSQYMATGMNIESLRFIGKGLQIMIVWNH